MALTFPRSVFMEMFLNGWTDVTSYVHQTNPVTITRGRANEQAKVAPAKLSARMKNNTGNMSPSNPMGAFYPLLNRNVPLRWGVLVARDLFSRVVVDGLGSTTTGEAWTLDGTAADFDVGGSTATIAIAAASTVRHAYLTALAPLADYEVTVDVTVPYPNGTDNFAGVVFRGTTTADAWRLSLTVTSTGAVNLNIADGAGAPKGSVYAVDTVSAGTYRVRVLVEDGTVRGKAWPVASPEPYAWQVFYIAETGINATGWMGIRARTGAGAANVTFTFDNFTVRAIRFHGELADLKPRWDESHKIKWANLEAAGILRRLQQGNSPLLSAMRRVVLRSATQPIAYWSCEDGKDATSFASATGGAPMIVALGKPRFAASDDFVCSDNLPELNKSVLQAVVPNYTSASTQVRFMASIPAGGDVDGAILARVWLTGTVWFIDFVYNTGSGGKFGLKWYDTAGSLILDDSGHVSGTTLGGMDGNPKQIILNLTQNGANIDWRWDVGDVPPDMNVGEASGNLGTLTSRTIGRANLLWFGSDTAFSSTALGHVAVYSVVGDIFTSSNEFGAWTGERALARFNRLCAEEGLSSSYIGTPSTSAKMGPQRVRKLVDLLGECAAATGGDLYESRSAGDLVLRDGGTLYGQGPAVTLDYSAKQVSAPLEPGADDQATRNDITVKRTNGSSYRVQQLTGPINVQNPGSTPDAVGRYDTSVEVNVHNDTQLPDIANALLSQGTVKEDRYPKIRVDLAATGVAGNTALEAALMNADIDDRVKVTNLSAADIFEPIDQISRGYTEMFRDELSHEIIFNTAPYSPYQAVILDTSRLDTDTTTLAADLTTTATSVSITPGGTLWTTSGGEFPFPIMINGERMTATACSGAGPTQTLTVTRSVNSVVRTHTTGDAVRLADPVYLG